MTPHAKMCNNQACRAGLAKGFNVKVICGHFIGLLPISRNRIFARIDTFCARRHVSVGIDFLVSDCQCGGLWQWSRDACPKHHIWHICSGPKQNFLEGYPILKVKVKGQASLTAIFKITFDTFM